MSLEKATARRGATHRSVKLPGKTAVSTDKDPRIIARELRDKSKLGQREARLKAAEACR